MVGFTLLSFICFMSSEKQVSRKKFLGWSGFALVSSLFVSGKTGTNRDSAVPVKMSPDRDVQAMSRIRPARGAVERRTV